MRKENLSKKRGMAIGQILVMIVGIIAISYALGAQIGFVSAAAGCTSVTPAGSVTGNSFCYYQGNSYTFSQYTAKVIQTSAGKKVVITRSDGWTYTQNSDGSWEAYNSVGTDVGPVTATTEAKNGVASSTNLGTFESLADAAAKNAMTTLNSKQSATPPASNTNGAPANSITDITGLVAQYGPQAAEKILNCLQSKSLAQCEAQFGGSTGSSGTGGSTPTYSQDYSGYTNWLDCQKHNGGNCGTNPCAGLSGDAQTKCVSPGGSGGSGSGINWSQAGKIAGTILSVTAKLAAAVGSAIAIHALLDTIEKSLLPGVTSTNGAGAAWLELGAYVGGGIAAGVTLSMLTKGVGLAHLSSTGVLGLGGLSGLGAIGIGAAIAVVAFFVFYQQHSTLLVSFTCEPWQAPTGGSQCQQCGSNGLPCSQYQCASLGQGCKLLNSGQDGAQICANVRNGDTVPPAISTLDSVLQTGYAYNPSALTIPTTSGDTGVRLQYKGGDVPPFTPVTIGIQTKDEPSKCGIYTSRLPLKDSSGKDTFDSLIPMDSGLFAYNHSFTLSLPSPDAANASGIEISAGGVMNLYIRCEDANGNIDPYYFVIQMKVSSIPDTSQPVIVNTSVENGAPVAFNASWAQIGVYVSKPVSGCKWDHSDQTYQSMAYTMDCSHASNVLDINSQGLYTCLANLTGIKDGVKNTYYFRCNDTVGNVNTANPAYAFNLLGTQPLHIDSVNPNGTTIKDSTSPVKVTINVQTSAGADQGNAVCYYYDNSAGTFAKPQDVTNYIQFYNTGSYKSSQDLYLINGNYDYNIKCVDAAGNADYSEVKFTAQVDKSYPLVVRAYHDATSLSIVTNENASCVYDVTDCNYQFSDGTPMTTADNITHSIAWVPGQTTYILCKDDFGNLPPAGTCSMVIQPSDL